jgi:hypothetical protein
MSSQPHVHHSELARLRDEKNEAQQNRSVAVGQSGSVGILPGGYFAQLLARKDPMQPSDKDDAIQWWRERAEAEYRIAEQAKAEAVELRAAIIEHRKRHPKLTSNADTQLWWKAGL